MAHIFKSVFLFLAQAVNPLQNSAQQKLGIFVVTRPSHAMVRLKIGHFEVKKWTRGQITPSSHAIVEDAKSCRRRMQFSEDAKSRRSRMQFSKMLYGRHPDFNWPTRTLGLHPLYKL